MPFYQEIDTNETAAIEEEERIEARKRRYKKINTAQDEEDNLRKLEIFHRRPCAFNRNEIMVRVYDPAEKQEDLPRAGPMNIIEAELKEK